MAQSIEKESQPAKENKAADLNSEARTYLLNFRRLYSRRDGLRLNRRNLHKLLDEKIPDLWSHLEEIKNKETDFLSVFKENFPKIFKDVPYPFETAALAMLIVSKEPHELSRFTNEELTNAFRITVNLEKAWHVGKTQVSSDPYTAVRYKDHIVLLNELRLRLTRSQSPSRA